MADGSDKMTAGEFASWLIFGGLGVCLGLIFIGVGLQQFGVDVAQFGSAFRVGKSELIYVMLVLLLALAGTGAIITMIKLGKIGQKSAPKP